MSCKKSFPLLLVALFCLALLSAFAFVTPAHAQEAPMSEDQIAAIYGVEKFTALPYDLKPGYPVQLSWEVTNAELVQMIRHNVDGTTDLVSTGKSGDGPDYPPGSSGTVMYELKMTNDPGQGWGSNFRYVQFIAQPQVTPTPQPTPEPTPAPETCPLTYQANRDIWDSPKHIFAPQINGPVTGGQKCVGGGTIYEPVVTVGVGKRIITAGPAYSITVQVGSTQDGLQVTVGQANTLTAERVDSLTPYAKTSLSARRPIVFCDVNGPFDTLCPEPSVTAAKNDDVTRPAGVAEFMPVYVDLATGTIQSSSSNVTPIFPPDFPVEKILEIWKHLIRVEYQGVVFHPPCAFPVYRIMGDGPYDVRTMGKCYLTYEIAPLHPMILGDGAIGWSFLPLGSDGGGDSFPASKDLALYMATNGFVYHKLGDISRSTHSNWATVRDDLREWVRIHQGPARSRIVTGEVPVAVPGQEEPVWTMISVKSTEVVATLGSAIDIGGQYLNAGWQFATSFTYSVVLLPDPSCGLVDLNGDGWKPFTECYYSVNQ